MRPGLLALALLGAFVLAPPAPVLAQGAAPEEAQATTPRGSRAARADRPKREPSVARAASDERRRKCGSEWREAKAKNATGGLKWPKFYSQCNARLKGNSA